MALKEQVSNVYGVGLRNVGSYQVSGTPWVTGSAIDVNESQRHSLPNVSKSFTVINTGSADLFVHFIDGVTNPITADGDGGAKGFDASADLWYTRDHYVTIGSNGSVTFDVKCKFIFITNKSSSAGTGGYQIFAELTNIPPGRMYALTGSGIDGT
tara:strand:- start:5818 stop:6282 length:465 start_codon:yes stop_codon:yes gene_type:complete